MQLSTAERLAEIAEFMRYARTVWPRERNAALAALGARCEHCVLSERCTPLVEGLCGECRALLDRGRPRAPEDGHAHGAAGRGSLAASLHQLLLEHQGKGAGWYDALVMFSGGKDSALLLHELRKQYPRLRLLAVTLDHGFTSSVALAAAQRVAALLPDVDYCMFRPRQGLYEKTFRYTLTHQDQQGCYASVERMAGDLGLDICRNLAASQGIPLLIHGGTREQVERNLAVAGYETDRASERRKRERVDRFVLADIYSPDELVYWWDGTRWPEQQLPRIIFPYCVWPYDEGNIRRQVVSLGYFPSGHEDPLASNSDVLPINLALDIQRLGYTSYEPDFARLVRAGKAKREAFLDLFQAIEHLARQGRFLPRCIADALGRLRLTHAQLGLAEPPPRCP